MEDNKQFENVQDSALCGPKCTGSNQTNPKGH